MNNNKIYINNALVKRSVENVQGETTVLNGQHYYKISNYHQMPPFFMSIVSNSDLWMFLSSNGALTAGRRNPDHALFHITRMIESMTLMISLEIKQSFL